MRHYSIIVQFERNMADLFAIFELNMQCIDQDYQ